MKIYLGLWTINRSNHRWEVILLGLSDWLHSGMVDAFVICKQYHASSLRSLFSCIHYSRVSKWENHPFPLPIYYSAAGLTRRRLLTYPPTPPSTRGRGPRSQHVSPVPNYAHAEMSQALSKNWPVDLNWSFISKDAG